MKNQSVIQHNAITIVQTIHVCLHHIRTHRLVHVQIQKKLVGANLKSTIHLGDSYMFREKTHGATQTLTDIYNTNLDQSSCEW
jgi:hypothetical protein